jgi:hypothetical protein
VVCILCLPSYIFRISNIFASLCLKKTTKKEVRKQTSVFKEKFSLDVEVYACKAQVLGRQSSVGSQLEASLGKKLDHHLNENLGTGMHNCHPS